MFEWSTAVYNVRLTLATDANRAAIVTSIGVAMNLYRRPSKEEYVIREREMWWLAEARDAAVLTVILGPRTLAGLLLAGADRRGNSSRPEQ